MGGGGDEGKNAAPYLEDSKVLPLAVTVQMLIMGQEPVHTLVRKNHLSVVKCSLPPLLELLVQGGVEWDSSNHISTSS